MKTHRCNKHTGRIDLPRLCSTCRRIDVEQEIVIKVVDALLGAGYFLQADIDDDARPAVPTCDREAILGELMEVDDEYLGAFRPGPEPMGTPDEWVRFVYGNEGWDVVSNYTTNLESILAPVNEYADQLGS